MLSLVLLVILITAAVNAQTNNQDTVAAGIATGPLNQLIDPIRTQLLPSLVQFVNEYYDDELTKTAKTGSCCRFGDVGAKATAGISNFRLPSTNANQISITTLNTGKSTMAQVRIRASNLVVSSSASASAGVSAVVPVTCSVRARATIKIGRIDIILDVRKAPNGKDLKLGVDRVDFSGVDVDLVPLVDPNVCSIGLSAIIGVFGTVAGLLVDILVPILKTSFLDFLNDQFGSETIPLAIENAFPLLNGSVKPSVDISTIQSTSSSLTTSVATTFEANLNSPPFRETFSFTPIIPANKALPAATISELASVHLGFPGVNSILGSIWYLLWSTLAEDEEGASSELCEPSPKDPCPFPPIVQEVSFFGFEGTLLNIVFGFHTNYKIYAVVPPPELDFVNKTLGGSVGAKMIIEGKILGDYHQLATVEGDLVVGASLPTYDANTGILSGLSIAKADIENVDIAFNKTGLFTGLLSKTAVCVIDDLFKEIVSPLVAEANKEIDSFFLNRPLKIPTINGFPIATKAVQFSLPGASLKGVEPTAGFGGYLDLDSGLAVNIIDTPNQFAKETTFKKYNATAVLASVYRRAYASVEEDKNPDATFLWSFDDPESNTGILQELRWSPAFSRVEMRVDGDTDNNSDNRGQNETIITTSWVAAPIPV